MFISLRLLVRHFRRAPRFSLHVNAARQIYSLFKRMLWDDHLIQALEDGSSQRSLREESRLLQMRVFGHGVLHLSVSGLRSPLHSALPQREILKSLTVKCLEFFTICL